MNKSKKEAHLKWLYEQLEKAEKSGDDVKINLIAQEIAALEGGL